MELRRSRSLAMTSRPFIAWHVVIDDQAAAKGRQAIIVQQFGGGRVYAHIEPFDPERELERISHGRVIIKHEEKTLCFRRSAELIHYHLAFTPSKPGAA